MLEKRVQMEITEAAWGAQGTQRPVGGMLGSRGGGEMLGLLRGLGFPDIRFCPNSGWFIEIWTFYSYL